MKTATHFFEVFRDHRGKQYRSALSSIRLLENNLKNTNNSETLKTLVVFKITAKPGVVIDTFYETYTKKEE